MRELDSGTRVSRKEHGCFFCGDPIAPETRYSFWVVVDGRELLRGKGHLECNEAWHVAGPLHDDPLPDESTFRSEVLAPYREEKGNTMSNVERVAREFVDAVDRIRQQRAKDEWGRHLRMPSGRVEEFAREFEEALAADEASL